MKLQPRPARKSCILHLPSVVGPDPALPGVLGGILACVVGERADFFVSHAGAERAWAEWVAWQLTDVGYTVELDAWDWARRPECRAGDE